MTSTGRTVACRSAHVVAAPQDGGPDVLVGRPLATGGACGVRSGHTKCAGGERRPQGAKVRDQVSGIRRPSVGECGFAGPCRRPTTTSRGKLPLHLSCPLVGHLVSAPLPLSPYCRLPPRRVLGRQRPPFCCGPRRRHGGPGGGGGAGGGPVRVGGGCPTGRRARNGGMGPSVGAGARPRVDCLDVGPPHHVGHGRWQSRELFPQADGGHEGRLRPGGRRSQRGHHGCAS
ncbi:hypothetical protein I4F81_012831 [Pyropia yezoensis]|uniref:Uncharacterized protein n=1 Tax=Pyropia yezoensis TaxID=2788 RepID=A0ACC3CK87_PYRYE|nr:hypothetical protein I4F81_012831 [Neopyropia yezoensis]